MIKLSKTSKIPGYSWSIEARENCNRGKVLSTIEGTVCSKCYACKGRYIIASVKNARRSQFEYYMSTPQFDWIGEMVQAISAVTKVEKSFRWFDSGDLISVGMLRDIVQVCVDLPDVRFWLPTRETGILSEYFGNGYTTPSNLNIRVSMDYIGETSEKHEITQMNSNNRHWTRHVTFSTVSANRGFSCPATHSDDHTCGRCRMCWDSYTTVVDYGKH